MEQALATATRLVEAVTPENPWRDSSVRLLAGLLAYAHELVPDTDPVVGARSLLSISALADVLTGMSLSSMPAVRAEATNCRARPIRELALLDVTVRRAVRGED